MVKTIRFLPLILLVVLVGVLGGGVAVFAQEEPPPVQQSTLNIETKYPVLSAESGNSYSFELTLKYLGEQRKRFDITTSVPADWVSYATAGYPEKQVAAVEIGPSASYEASESINIYFAPVFWLYPEPGDYKVTVKVSSGDLEKSVELVAKVTAKYDLNLTTESGNLSTQVTAGKDNHFTLKLENLGSIAVEDITFSTSKPEGWDIKFSPQKIDSLAPTVTQDIDVIINPPKGKTIAGDYMVTVKADSQKIAKSADIRVTVLTPSILGYVGIVIVLVVIGGLAVLFRQLGRR